MKIKKKIFRRFLAISHFVSLILLCISYVQAAGMVDPTFNAPVYGSLHADIYVIKTQADGKVLVGGNFSEINGIAKAVIARFNADGSLDASFNPPDILSGGAFGRVFAIGLQSDGKIIIGGEISTVNGVYAPGLKRLNIDGSYDATFTTPEITGSIYDIEIQPDNKIIAGGSFIIFSENIEQMVRLNANGTLDTDFGIDDSSNPIMDLDLQPDGKIVTAGRQSETIKRYNSNGTVDASFLPVTLGGMVSWVYALEILANGKILMGGDFSSVNGFPLGKIVLLNPDGSLDLNFNLNNPGANGAINDIAVRADGKIIIGGAFTAYNSTARQKVALLNADGTLDTSFATDSTLVNSVVNDVEALPGGKILAGTNTNFFARFTPTLVRFNANGSADSSFVPFLTRVGHVRRILQNPDGKILIGGDFSWINGIARDSLAQLNADGSLDASFVPINNVVQGVHQTVSALAAQPDGKIMVAAPPSIFKLYRLLADGSIDPFYGNTNWQQTSVINDIVVLGNGQILVGGTFNYGSGTRFFTRLNSNGAVDATFPVDLPNGVVNKILLQPDGKILIAGDFSMVGTFIRGKIARYNANGTLDTSFNPPGGANGAIDDMDLQTDGKIIVGGSFTSLNGSVNQVRIGRFNADGTLDTSFAQSTNAAVLAVKVLPDGKVLLGGQFSLVGTTPRYFLARLNANSSLDSGFNPTPNGSVYDITLQADNRILIAGDFTTINGISKLRAARLLNDARVPFDFDGDGKTDISIYRPSLGQWWIKRSTSGVVTTQGFGGNLSDKIIPADFTGDGRTDLAIFRPPSSEWFILRSEDSTSFSFQFGDSTDIPAPADYDGDGRADVAVFRPSIGTWFILPSSGGANFQQFGLNGDVPVAADYDGDGKSDIAIYRPSNGQWWIQRSTLGTIAYTFGNSSDKPTQGDFTGDNKTDVAFWRPSTGEWFILRSEDFSYYAFPFGTSTDIPAPGDYDGDGKTDAAVFRPAESTWYVNRSTAGTLIQTFGEIGDVPVPNAFVP